MSLEPAVLSMLSRMPDLVFIGGGHSHSIALRRFAERPSAAKLTLITDTLHAPYSGMLPGYVRGYYNFAECHIDLADLAKSASAELILDRAIGLNIQQKQVLCANREPIDFDILAIDIGSTPQRCTVPGATEFAIPAKPVPEFLAAWHQLLAAINQGDLHSPISLGIVGGGAGGVELALNIQGRLAELWQARGGAPDLLQVHLFHRQLVLMAGSPVAVGQKFRRLLESRGIKLHLGRSVVSIDEQRGVHLADGSVVNCHHVFWVTDAAAPDWLQASGLATDSQGFILVRNTLQSISHPAIFATGDIATIVDQPRPKAGVFAVRQGPTLVENLRRVMADASPRPFYAQRRYLALVGTGEQQAIAIWDRWSWGPLGWLWQWKERIDRQFMGQFPRSPRECLIVFTRYPELGKVKTRLIAALGETGATNLHRQMAEHTLVQAKNWQGARSDRQIEVWFTGGSAEQMAGWLGADLDYQSQPAGDLGDRMAAAFRGAFDRGYGSVVIVGTDCPGMNAEILQEGFDLLRQQDLLLGPALDGGYYLIGLQRLIPELFRSIPWSTATVFRQTDERAASLGLSRAYLQPLADVDLPEDLEIQLA